MERMKEKILLKRKYLLADRDAVGVDKRTAMYYAAQLLNKFGVIVSDPSMLTPRHIQIVSDLYGVDVPRSFYSNPQDTRYFTCDELLLEQLVSYINIEFFAGVNSMDESQFDRIELFRKTLPNYKEGSDIVFREYTIVDNDRAEELLQEVAENLATYTRKWSESESEEFQWLYQSGYAEKVKRLKGKDNAIEMFNHYLDVKFARSLDQKDVVKLSIEMVGENERIEYRPNQKLRLGMAVANCRRVPLSKKQAKYFNTIAKHTGVDVKHESNLHSPHKKVVKLMKQDRVVEAARVYAQSGSLLTRNLSWLLSRATPREAIEIIDMVEVKSPIVTMQFLQSLLEQSNEPRVFSFYKDRKVMHHVETDYEARNRKSVLSRGMKRMLKEGLMMKIDEFYENLPSLGNVYIDDAFKKIAVPFNTSADGDGIDTVPTGTRQKITDDYIRAFCYWKNLFDVDSSVEFQGKNGKRSRLYWGNYHAREFGDSALTSGDDRSRNGAEYIDFRLSELEALGWEYAVYKLNGYGGDFDHGETYCGYQNKSDLHTRAWDPKNMALKIKLPTARSREYTGFVIDIKNREVIVINQMQEGRDRVTSDKVLDYVKKYLNSDYVRQFNIYKIASLRGNVVDDPSEADVIFSDDVYELEEGQKQYRTTDTEKLVSIMT